MAIEREKYLPYLDRFLSYSGIEIKPDGMMRCPNSGAHKNGDNHFSAKMYKNESNGHSRVKCFGCGFDGDIYDIAGHYHNEKEFKEQYTIIEKMFGGSSAQLPAISTDSKKPEKEKLPPVSVDPETAKGIYNNANFDRVRSFSKNELIANGKIVRTWTYYDLDGNVAGVDARIEAETASPESGKKEKMPVTFWYNGKHLKITDGPYLIYNLYNSIKGSGKDKPIVIHEGAKCADLANNAFTATEGISYNRGSQNADKHDWSAHYDGRKVYILQDNDTPGIQAANKIKAKLPQAIILKNIYQHFEIQDVKGADIEQLLEQAPAADIEKYILNYSESKEKEELEKWGPICLGVSDTGMLFFIDRSQRLFSIKRNRIQKDNLMVLCPLEYWESRYGNEKGVVKWDDATNDVLTESFSREFDDTKIRGRGAWREGDMFVYHDGKTTHGETSGEYMYLRKNKRDIGINETPIGKPEILRLRELANDISFANTSDLIKLLSWSLISPFCGALRFRPGLLLTGESGSGKTTVLETIVKPLSAGKHYNTHHSSPAGVRADIGNDSCAIMLEEAEANQNTDDQDKNTTRNNFFSMMRASSSDDSPEGVKSNADQQVVKYSMKNMFLFVSITPSIAEIADDNRIFKVNFEKKKHIAADSDKDKRKWEVIEGELIKLLNRENCRRIRAHVWRKFGKIINDTHLIIDVMKYDFHKSSRTADGESILISTYLNIFKDIDMTRDNIKKFLEKYYTAVGKDEERNETDELTKKIYDQVIEIQVAKERKKISIKEALDCLKNKSYDMFMPDLSYCEVGTREIETRKISDLAEKEIRRIIGHYGISFQRDGNIALANNNDNLKRILNRENGYAKLFHRHRNFVAAKAAYINNQTQNAVIIDIYRDEKKYDPDVDNIPF